MNLLKLMIFFIIVMTVSTLAFYLLIKPSKTSYLLNEQKTKPIYLRFGHNTPIDSALHQAALRYAKLIHEKSGGEVRIDVFPAQQLGNDHQMVEMARNGKLDILLTPTAKMSVAVPSMQYADLPFYFPSREDLYAMLDGEPGQILLNKLRSIGLIGVTFWENGFKHFTGNKPLVKPEDFEGTKIRVMKSRIIMEQFKSFGAEPLPIDFHATKKALKDGIVEGQENPLIAIVSMGFHKVQSHLILSEHAYLGYVFSISEKSFDTLPLRVRTLLVETAKEVTPWERNETKTREAKLLEQIQSEGVTIHRLTPKQRQAFAQKTAHIAKQFEPLIGTDLISKTEELLMKKYGPQQQSKKQIVIGVDADLSMDSSVAGLAIKRGVELAVDEINRAGGLLGRPLAVIAKDHRTVTSQGIHNVKAFAAREDLVAVIGGKHSAIISGEKETIQNERIPYLIPWAAAAELTENGQKSRYIFRVSANDRFLSKFLIRHALTHGKKPLILAENSVWGRGFVKGLGATFHDGAMGAEAVVFNRGEELFEKELEQVRRSKPDCLILVANPVEGSAIVRALGKAKIEMPIIAHWGVVGGAFYQKNRVLLERIHFEFVQTVSLLHPKREAAKKFVLDYLKKYRVSSAREIKAPTGAAHAYDLVKMLAMAITKAGTTDRVKVREALEHLPPYEGVVKYYERPFSPQKHDALALEDFYLAKYDSRGIIIPVYRDKKIP